eukprot:CAMPEP_0205824112 /NCGR_PEP_ID=MMETSP0206-20130828/19499_1 /ASSEMBLY_ACC=CAM_ASM_000279 /TAXON_ID=36767 /ORGANISM="Euplotes focardii, Strain TN1" /LENGTH=156 /DNA_ID=CAMNT_0053121919 /DNA_START=136 /DNA_END=606 /DNA_ORIENTATION=+
MNGSTVEDGIGTLGITDFAQNQLGDVVYVELPEVGAEFESSEAFGSVESVKAASQVYLPVSGEITEVNENLEENCALVNTAAESDGWMVKIQLSDESQLEELMDRDAYTAFCEEEAKERTAIVVNLAALVSWDLGLAESGGWNLGLIVGESTSAFS